MMQPIGTDTHRNATEISAAAEGVDALLLGVEVMIQSQRQMMTEAKVGDYMLNNELWSGITVLLTMARHETQDIGRAGDAIQVATMGKGSAS